MGLADILGGLTGRRAPKTGDPLMDILLPMLLKGGAIGGLGGLLGKFTSAGLGGQANSWVGTGDNQSLDPDDIDRALGADEVDRIAREAGMSHTDAAEGLATMIPGLVDKASPGGSLQTGHLDEMMKDLDLSAILGG